jgi:hypothetical protein
MGSLNRFGIAGHDGIGGHQDNRLDHGLSYQNAVERIFVNGRQTANSNGMIAGSRYITVTVFGQSTTQHAGVHPEIRPSEPALDGGLPHTRRAEKQLVGRVL